MRGPGANDARGYVTLCEGWVQWQWHAWLCFTCYVRAGCKWPSPRVLMLYCAGQKKQWEVGMTTMAERN